jgi:beta-lactamase regulating signal transducer with metallopeptidase domain
MAELMNSLVPALGYALLHFLWQGTLIGLIAASALIALRRARPQVRYTLACIALAACVVVPVVTLIAQLGSNTPLTLSATRSSFGTLLAAGMQSAVDSVGGSSRVDAALPWVVALWALGTCLLSLRLASGFVWIQRMRTTPQAAAQTTWQTRLDVLAAPFGLRGAIALRLVDALDTPVSAGWWRPVVLLPTALIARMPVELIDALLAHELAHIRRHDYLVNLLQNAVEALLFYHPVVWWLSRQIRDEREMIADQLAVSATGAPRNLALALSELAEMRRVDAVRLHLAPAARGGRLLLRIQRLIRPETSIGGGHLSLAFVSLVAAGIAVHAQSQLTPRDATPNVQTTVSTNVAMEPPGQATVARETLEDIVLTEHDATNSTPFETEWNTQIAASSAQYQQAIEQSQRESQQMTVQVEAEMLAHALVSTDMAAQAAEEVEAMQLHTGALEIAQDQMHAAAEAAEDAAAQATEAAEIAQYAAAEAANAAQEAAVAIEAATAAAAEAATAASSQAAAEAAAEAASAAASEAATEAASAAASQAAAHAEAQAALQKSAQARAQAEADAERRSAQENEHD